MVRSYGRLPTLCDLLEVLLGQDHPSFEVVVVEQTPSPAAADVARLDALARDPRLRVLRHPPLGGARARNVGATAARGEILVFIDDDDLPLGTGWLRELALPFADPRCAGVTCRHMWRDTPEPSARYRRRAARRCMRFSPLLRMPLTMVRLDRPVTPVDYVHGTGGAIRRSVLERVGGWDEDTAIEDETSFGLRFAVLRRPDEYLAFVPSPVLLRDLGVSGGLDKRGQSVTAYFAKLMRFVHRVLARYRPVRVRLLYPLYVLTCVAWTLDWLFGTARAYPTPRRRLGAAAWLIVGLGFWSGAASRVPFGRRHEGRWRLDDGGSDQRPSLRESGPPPAR